MRVIRAEQVREHLEVEVAVSAIEGAFADHLAGRTAVSEPPLLRLQVDGRARFQAKAAKVGGMVGLRLAGERDDRHVDEGRRIVLYDAERLVPVAIVDERELYRLWAGAQIAVTVRELRPVDASVLTVVGAGRLARASIEAIQALLGFGTVRIHARTTASRGRLVEELRGRVSVAAWDEDGGGLERQPG